MFKYIKENETTPSALEVLNKIQENKIELRWENWIIGFEVK